VTSLLVFVVHHEGGFYESSLGALTEGARVAAELGGDCHALVVGDRAELSDELCAILGRHGATRVYRVQGPAGLAQPVVDAMAAALADGDHAHALFGGGLLGFEAGAGLAARLAAGLAVDVTALRVSDGELLAERSVLGDSQVSSIRFRSGVGVVVARANAFESVGDVPRRAEVRDLSVDYRPHSLGATMITRGERRGVETGLEDAEVIVAGGRGLGHPDGFRQLEELAGVLGGDVGATRAVVDMGWYPYASQVGQTGKTVTPRLYVAAGISGAIQHKVGMEHSEHIVAINRDARAPIFAFSHLGVVADLHAIVPALTEALRARRRG
jgi:electron transfer flavoprotein alpha subunit